MIKKLISLLCVVCLFSVLFSSCKKENNPENSIETTTLNSQIDSMDFGFTENDLDSSVNEADAIKINIEETPVITKGGTYILSGNLKDEMLKIEADKNDKVKIVFKNVSISNSDGPAVYIKQADKVFITLAENSENTISDGDSYSVTDDETNLDSAIFSREDLTINGSGKLTINGNYKHGIVSKDDLVITGGNIDISAKNVAISGKDCVKITSPSISINAGTDGIRCENAEDSSLGYIYIKDGSFKIISGNDAVQSGSVLKISNGKFDITSGGGSENSSTQFDGSFNDHWNYGQKSESDTTSESAKGLKASSDLLIDNGSFTIDSADDSLHSNSSVSISGGTFEISSGDDAIHADSWFSVSKGTINILKSYEGIEANSISVSGGNLSVISSDDGFNAAGGNDFSGMGGKPGEGNFSGSDSSVNISGGYILINAGGDGLDSNGSLNVSGGVTLVSGPTNDGNGSFDYGSSATVTGGIVIALGTSGMAQNFSETENQGAILYNFTTQQYAESTFALCDEKDNVIVSFTPPKIYRSVVVTAPEIQEGKTYKIVTGATVKNADKNGFAHNSKKNGGTVSEEIEMTSSIYGSSNGMGGFPNGNMGEPPHNGSGRPGGPPGR